MDWLSAQAPPSGVRIESLTNDWTTLVLAGPRSRELLLSVGPRTGWSQAAFPWLSVREVRIGAVPAVAMSVSFSGEFNPGTGRRASLHQSDARLEIPLTSDYDAIEATLVAIGARAPHGGTNMEAGVKLALGQD